MQNVMSNEPANGLSAEWPAMASSLTTFSANQQARPASGYPASSFAETLANIQQPQYQEQQTSTTNSSASLLQQLRSDGSWRTTSAQVETTKYSGVNSTTNTHNRDVNDDRRSETAKPHTDSRSDNLRHSGDKNASTRKGVTSASASASKVQQSGHAGQASTDDDVVELSGGQKPADGPDGIGQGAQTGQSQLAGGGGTDITGVGVAVANVKDLDATGTQATGIHGRADSLKQGTGGGTAVDASNGDVTTAANRPTGKPKPGKQAASTAGATATTGGRTASAILDPNSLLSSGTGSAAQSIQNSQAPAANAAATEAVANATPANASSVKNLKGKGVGSDLAFALKIDGIGKSAGSKATPSQDATGNTAEAASGAGNGNIDLKALATHQQSTDAAASTTVPSDATMSDSFASTIKAAAGGSSGGKNGSGSGSGSAEGSGTGAAPVVAPATGQAFSPELSQTAAGAPAPGEVKTLEPVDEKSAAAPGLKSVQVQVTNDNNERVDLRLVEKAGALTISVRGGDAALTKALQQNLPSLAGKLNDQQVRTEWWTPQASKVEAANKSEEPSNGNQDRSASQDQGRQGGQPGQQGGRGARQQPDWVDDLVDTRKSNQNGAQYAWHL